MQTIMQDLPGTLRTKMPVKPILVFVDVDQNEHKIQVEFPSLTHWGLFAYSQQWRDQWEDMVGAPFIEVPPKWSRKIGRYIGSWADAADSADEDEELNHFSD
jgi:hypothetical protein